MMESEKKQAYADLESAINRILDLDGHHGVLTDWMIIHANQGFDDDGDGTTVVSAILPYDGIPYYRIMGLLSFMTTIYKDGILNG